MKDDIFSIAMGGFLHDLGKIGQRGEIPLSKGTENLIQDLCPSTKRGFSHQHVLWTNQFLDDHQEILTSISGISSDHWARINAIASNHHRDPSSPEEAMIREADHLSSGHDRETSECEAQEGEQNVHGRNRYKYVPLRSILTDVCLENGRSNKPTQIGVWTIPDYSSSSAAVAGRYPKMLSPEQIERGTGLEASECGPQRYQSMWKWMEQTLAFWQKHYSGISRGQLAQGMDSIGQLAWSYFPASTWSNENDVSLYDHARLVAALSAAMAQYHIHTKTWDIKAVLKRDIRKYRFVVGTLSGIQDYIFRRSTESQRGAARRYRARSFILSLITQITTARILDRLGLPIFNRIIDAGGRFTLLIDNTPETLLTLEHAVRDILEDLNRSHCGLIHLHMDWQKETCGLDFLDGRFADIYLSLQDRIDRAKHQDQRLYLQNKDGWQEKFFIHQDVIREKGNLKEWEKQDADIAAEVGSALPGSQYLALSSRQSKAGGLLQCLGMQVDFCNQIDPGKDCAGEGDFTLNLILSPDLQALPPAGLFLNLCHVPRWTKTLIPLADRLAGQGVEEPEMAVPGQIISFQTIAHLVQEEENRGEDISTGDLNQAGRGTAMLACLKADVDHLGRLFTRGFGRRTSIGRIVTFSRQLDQFFKINLAELLDHHHYVIFSGGDDLFIVGTWNHMLLTLRNLRRRFTEYVGSNPDLTFSAGLVFGKPKSPIYELGESADEAISIAKNQGRNRLHLLGRTFEWGQFSEALDQAKELEAYSEKDSENEKISRVLLYRLLQFEKMAFDIDRQSKEGKKVTDKQKLLWRSHLRYDLARNVKDDEVREWLLKFTFPEQGSRLVMSPNVRLATTYVLYKTRNEWR